jgi:hypothetical protein
MSEHSACGPSAAVICLVRTQIYDHPWYNKNLPPGVKEMNDHPQPLPVGLQSQEEIQKIVAVRCRRHSSHTQQYCGICPGFPAICTCSATSRQAWVWLLSVC